MVRFVKWVIVSFMFIDFIFCMILVKLVIIFELLGIVVLILFKKSLLLDIFSLVRFFLRKYFLLYGWFDMYFCYK